MRGAIYRPSPVISAHGFEDQTWTGWYGRQDVGHEAYSHLHVTDGSKRPAVPLQFGTSAVVRAARTRLKSPVNCLRRPNTDFLAVCATPELHTVLNSTRPVATEFYRIQSVLLFNHSWGEKMRHDIPKGISTNVIYPTVIRAAILLHCVSLRGAKYCQ